MIHPIIGISGSHNIADRQLFVRENYMQSVLRAGGIPVLLPEIEDKETAAQILEPSRLTRYLLDLSALFHSFYNSCRVKVDDGELMQARMFLIKNVRTVIRNTLAILKIDAPEKM